MQKTNNYEQIPHATMFFPKIMVTREEMKRMHEMCQIRPQWMKQFVLNYDDFSDIVSVKRPSGGKKKYWLQMVDVWSHYPEEIIADIKAFADGTLDLIDFVVKYAIWYKDCKKFFIEVLEKAGIPFDVDSYWKQHKKHAQKQTTVALYGVAHTAMRPEVQAKRIATNRRIYGADNPMQIPEIKEKLRVRVQAEHGVDYTFQKRSSIPAWQKKLFSCLTTDETWKEILSDVCEREHVELQYEMFDEVLPLSRRDFVISELSNTHVEDLLRLWQTKTGQPVVYPENALFRLPFAFSKSWLKYYDKKRLLVVPELYYRQNASVYENHLEHFLDSIGVSYVRNHKKALDGLEMDFYIPEKAVGIEVNPNVSHNSNLYALTPTRSMFDSRKEPSYHYGKYRAAKDAGITLIQLFGNDLETSVFEHITAKRLKSLLCGYEKTYYARKVTVFELTSKGEKKQARDFLDMYHSQGASRANTYWMFRQGEDWLGVASFSKHKEAGAMELKRLCFRPGVQVVGGLSKLVAHYFRNHPDCQTIYSYSDNSLGNGASYGKAGAVFVKETGPALKFISPKDGHDSYSWQIATSWGADKGVVGMDAEQKGLPKPVTQDEIDDYIETTLSHRSDDMTGYDRIYTPGSKLWKFVRKE